MGESFIEMVLLFPLSNTLIRVIRDSDTESIQPQIK